MFDGSKLSLDENIRKTLEARKLTDSWGGSLEGEVGMVPYSDLGETNFSMTDAAEAGRFTRETGVDVLAVSVGNIHRLTEPTARIDFNRLREIEETAETPLVIHGVSGLPESDIRRLLSTGVAKFNIGTRLRMAFGKRLRETLNEDMGQFDRLRIMKSVIPAMRESAVDSLIIAGW
jgi:fructose-bisphosphate aldolase class II